MFIVHDIKFVNKEIGQAFLFGHRERRSDALRQTAVFLAKPKALNAQGTAGAGGTEL